MQLSTYVCMYVRAKFFITSEAWTRAGKGSTQAQNIRMHTFTQACGSLHIQTSKHGCMHT